MKTWQMIKELTENPGKKFKRVGDQLEVSVDIDDSLLWKSGCSPFNINHVWEEVKEPISFMEVVKSGKGFTVRHELIQRKSDFENLDLCDFTLELADIFYPEQIQEILLEGKFYIED